MIYGRMSADLKEHQSNEFNNRAGKIKILIATNAIGMGINLNIDRVIFSTITDIGGSKRRMTHSHQLMDHEILQVAGRAGRFLKEGRVTAFEKNDLNVIRLAIKNNNVT